MRIEEEGNLNAYQQNLLMNKTFYHNAGNKTRMNRQTQPARNEKNEAWLEWKRKANRSELKYYITIGLLH